MITTLIIRASGLVLLYAMTICLTRVLGGEVYGQWAMALATASILAVFAGLGLPVLLVRELAIEKDGQRRRHLVAAGYQATLVSSAVIILGILLMLAPVGEGMRTLAIASLVLFPALAFVHLRQGISLTLVGAPRAILPEQIFLPALVMAGVLLLLRVERPSLISAVGIYAASSWLVLVIAVLLARNTQIARAKPAFGLDADCARQLARKGVPFLLAQLPRVLVSNVDVVIVGLVMGAEAAGIYAVASRIANLVAMPLFVVNTSYMPVFAANAGKAGIAELDGQAAAFYSFAGGVLALLPLLIFPNLILGLFGTDFDAARPLMIILCLGQLLNAAMGPNGTMLLMTGNERAAIKATWFQAAILACVTYFCARTGSLLIVAVGVAASVFAANSLTSWLLWRSTGIFVYPRKPSGGYRKIWRTLLSGPGA